MRENGEKATASCNRVLGIALVAPKDNAQRLIGTTASRALMPTEREMKLIDLFSRARRRAHYPDEIAEPARPGTDVVDRSSMADLVRLLKEADDPQRGNGRQHA